MKTYKLIAGVDEAGRGCLAGPVVSAAVIFKKEAVLKNIKDSKKLSFKQRLILSKDIKKNKNIKIETIEIIDQVIAEIENLTSDTKNKSK